MRALHTALFSAVSFSTTARSSDMLSELQANFGVARRAGVVWAHNLLLEVSGLKWDGAAKGTGRPGCGAGLAVQAAGPNGGLDSSWRVADKDTTGGAWAGPEGRQVQEASGAEPTGTDRLHSGLLPCDLLVNTGELANI